MSAADQLRSTLNELYFRSSFSDWYLGRTPARALTIPVTDSRPGSPEGGRAIIAGQIIRDGVHLADTATMWGPATNLAANPGTTAWLHGFEWLRDLRDQGGEEARTAAREMVAQWMAAHNRWQPLPWRPDILGRRLACWVGLHDFFCEGAPDDFRNRLLASLAKQFAHLVRSLDASPEGSARFSALCGFAVAGIATEASAEQMAIMDRALIREIAAQIHGDGGHASRSPARHCAVLADLIDIRDALRHRARPIPEAVDSAVEGMTAMLRLWRHGDGKRALFNQSDEGTVVVLNKLIARAGGRRKAPRSAPNTGFERITASRSLVIVDAGAPSDVDQCTHAGLLSFEFSAGKQRLIVNCGSQPSESGWAAPLRSTAAHSTLVIDDTNALQVGGDGRLLASGVTVSCERSTAEDGSIFVDLEHDGYQSRFGLLHRRRLFLMATGDDLRGEDIVSYTGDPGPQPEEAVLRFHLHPKLRASILQNGAAALLRPPSGGVWRFRADAPLALKESVYFGSPERQRCEHILITLPLHTIREQGTIKVRWSLRREEGDRRTPRRPARKSPSTKTGE